MFVGERVGKIGPDCLYFEIIGPWVVERIEWSKEPRTWRSIVCERENLQSLHVASMQRVPLGSQVIRTLVLNRRIR